MGPLTNSGSIEPITGQFHDTAPIHVNEEITIRLTGLINLGISLLNFLFVMRYLLYVLAANPSHLFTRLVYTFTEPFLSVFQGLTRSPLFGDIAFELNLLIAVTVYSLIGWIAVKLIRILFAQPE